MKVIGICGYGATGSSAIYDLLREYEEINTFPSGRECEFTLPYDAGGLLSLEFYLISNPAKHLLGDYAISEFRKLTSYLERSYNRETNGNFTELTEAFIDKIVQVKYPCTRKNDFIGNKLSRLLFKLGRFLELRIEKYYREGIHILPRGNRYISIAPHDFTKIAYDYVNGILRSAGAKENSIFLLDQPFSPNFPERSFHYFENPYAIVVNRDPRDIYIYVKKIRAASAVEFIPHQTVEDFVKYYRAVSQIPQNENTQKVIRVNFEDFIYEYEKTVKMLENKLEVKRHVSPFKWFQPDISIRNTQIYRAFPELQNDIDYIEKMLPEYLYPFEKYHREVDKSKIISNDKFQKNK